MFPFQLFLIFISIWLASPFQNAFATRRLPSTTILRTSANTVEVTLATPAERQAYATNAKKRLLDLIGNFEGIPAERERIDLLLDGLSVVYSRSPMQTSVFFELCMKGGWKLEFTTTERKGPLIGPGGQVLRVMNITQQVSPASNDGSGEGMLGTVVAWDLSGEGRKSHGRFEVQSKYSLTTAGAMDISHNDYILEPVPGGELGDVTVLCALIERATPKELFETNETMVRTT